MRERGYQRNITSTLLTRFLDWASDLLRELFERATEQRGTSIIALSVIGVLILSAVARALILARARRLAATQTESEQTAEALLAEARALALQGAYAAGAHRLYAAVVARLVETGRARRHPSKTIGDYARDLRKRDDPLVQEYLGFARQYEVVAYGDGACDADRFRRLETLAAPLVAAVAIEPALVRAA